uniref:Uncharacterized protein n=1 Tax=viral metagenome TaxID=1070528 RepID=A0A6C0IWT1_9ZZZZ
MFYLASTRFNNETYQENMNYRKKKGLKVIYGTCVRIQARYSLDTILFVIEMNNETNKVEGISIIRNRLSDDNNKSKIYTNSDYNRYVYVGEYWLSREEIIANGDSELIEIFDLILFKGKSHVKRQAGISILTKKLMTNWDYELVDLEQRVKNLFLNSFRNVENNNIFENNLKTELDIENNISKNNLKRKKTRNSDIEFVIED